jgi:hypothetical protein
VRFSAIILLSTLLLLFIALGSASSLTWNTSSDWDNAVSETGVVHEEVQNTDLSDAGELKKGYSAATPLYSSSLVGYWPLDEDSGDKAYDLSGNNYDGTTSGGITQGNQGLLRTSSYEFDGSDDRVISSGVSSSSDSVTVNFWVYQTGRPHTNSGLIHASPSGTTFDGGDTKTIGIWTDDSDGDLWGRFIQSDGAQVNFNYNDGENLNLNEWHMVTQVANSSSGKAKQYIDGDLIETISYDGTLQDYSNFGMGRQGGETLEGKLEDVRLYKEPLSNSEIRNLYDATSKGKITTGWKNFASERDTSALKVDNVTSSLNGQSVDVKIEQDTDNDGAAEETSAQISLNGSGGPYNLEGISSRSKKYRLKINLSSNQVTTTPELSRLSLKTTGPAICDRRGNLGECISETTHDIDGKNIDLNSRFEAKETSIFEAFTTQAQLSITNSSIISGLWTGTFNLTADQITIKTGADFRPNNGRIILGED